MGWRDMVSFGIINWSQCFMNSLCLQNVTYELRVAWNVALMFAFDGAMFSSSLKPALCASVGRTIWASSSAPFR